MARQLARARLSFERERQGQALPFVLYEMPAKAALPARGLTVYGVCPESPSQHLAPLALPARLDGRLALLAVEVHREEGALEVETWWQVTGDPVSEPFSIMGHLLSAEGETLAVADGLGISPLGLLEGDVIVQRHRFSPLPEGTPASLLTGAYWRETMERWGVTGAPGASALLVELDGAATQP